MLCAQCKSSNRREFHTEMMIHHGVRNSDKPDILTFSKAWVFLDCGFSTFTVSKKELLAIRISHNDYTDNEGIVATEIVEK
jgi:hypothetical protein